MYCKHCGKEQKDTAKFCSFCGNKLSRQESIGEISSFESSKPATTTKTTFKDIAKVLKHLLILVFFVLAAKGIQYLGTKDFDVEIGKSVNQHLSKNSENEKVSPLFKYTESQMLDEYFKIYLDTMKDTFSPQFLAEKRLMEIGFSNLSSYSDKEKLQQIIISLDNFKNTLKNDDKYYEQFSQKVKEIVLKSDKFTEDFKNLEINSKTNIDMALRKEYINTYINYLEELSIACKFLNDHFGQYSIQVDPDTKVEQIYFDKDSDLVWYNTQVDVINKEFIIFSNKKELFLKQRSQSLGKYNVNIEEFNSFMNNL